MMINNINDPRKLLAGQTIKIGNLIFEPSKIKILVDLFHSKMYIYYKDHLLKKLPVAVGRADATPPGVYTVMEKRKNPALYWNGEIIPPGSLVNGLGTRWIGLSDPQYGIHGTTKPWEIGRRISHGCIRLRNEDVEKLFEFVPIGTEVITVENLDTIPEILTENMIFAQKRGSMRE
ncbi:MAG TPA: L,D-transpeptidase [Thermotogaceae bacterium]|nr:L,D-transpeptidase [Thermotogota bacterium]HEW91951.1 L,D-transpeptidase [Thermotogaceae bacterium]